MPQKWYYKTMIPIPGFIYKISFLKKWENLQHYFTYFERTLFIILLFGLMTMKYEFIVKCVWKFFFYQLHAQDCYEIGYADI